MNKLNLFLTKHATKIIIALLVLIYFKTCSVDSEVTKVKKELKATQAGIQSIDSMIGNLPDKYDMRIEALKSEKRMIQATDRRIIDIQRQSEIEREISELQNK